MTRRLCIILFIAVVTTLLPEPVRAQPPAPEVLAAEAEPPTTTSQWADVRAAMFRLPLATALASLLALRPRRRGTPKRDLAVVHTQIILAVVGTLVMMVVGQSLARAFGIVGAAGLVRYRAKIGDPKDAGVMLSTLAIGLASGVGLWMIAIFGTLFLLALLWTVESFEPQAVRALTVTIRAKDAHAVKAKVERVLQRYGAQFTVLGVSAEQLEYDVRWPADRSPDRLSERLAATDAEGKVEVEVDLEDK